MSHPLDDLDIGAIELFIAAAELGSISKAAARRHLSQPVASRKLRELERRLGFEVLHRSAVGVELSPRGTRFLQMSHELLAGARRFRDEASALAAGDQGVVLMATPNIVRHDLPRLAAGMADVGPEGEAHPAAIRLGVESTLEICRALRNDEVDIGLIDGPSAPLGLDSELLSEHELLTVVGPGHRWAARSRIGADELAGTPLLLPAGGTGTRDVIDAAFERRGFVAVPALLAPSGTDQRIAMAIMGSGATIVRAEAAAGHVADGRLVVVDVAWDGTKAKRARSATGSRAGAARRSTMFRQPVRVAWKGRKPARAIADMVDLLRRAAEASV
ncbi:MAG: LysR family transcriptional regulator [Actinomycetota bacterium]